MFSFDRLMSVLVTVLVMFVCYTRLWAQEEPRPKNTEQPSAGSSLLRRETLPATPLSGNADSISNAQSRVETEKVQETDRETIDPKREHQRKLREMQEKVVALKEKMFSMKARLSLLKEQILSNIIGEAWAIIIHRNEMGAPFTLQQAAYFLDGKQKLFLTNKDGRLNSQKEIEVFSGSVPPGRHKLRVELLYQGTGAIFTYLKGYRFRIVADYSFYAAQGRIVRVEAIGYEKGGLTYSLEDRPSLQFRTKHFRFNKENLARLTGKFPQEATER